ncbi:MAG: CdaR family protein [Chloroflexota bacterium]
MLALSWNWLKHNLTAFLLAFAMAVAVWVSAVVMADPDKEELFPRPIPIQIIGLEPSLLLVGSIPQQAEITLRAPTSVWDQLLSDSEAIQITADLTGLEAGTYIVPLQPKINTEPVRIISLQPDTIRLTLEPLTTREFPVHLVVIGEPALGYQASPYTLTPNIVTISGPVSLVDQVAKVIVELHISGARDTISELLQPMAIDAQGAQISDISFNPDSLHILQPIKQLGGYRDVAVKVNIIGQVANGYRVTNITITPPVITVFSSDPARVSELPGYIETEPLDLTGARDDLDKRLTLNLPDGISVVGEHSVLVRVSIAAVEGSVTISLPVERIGLNPGLQAVISPSSVDVILSGPLPELENLTSADVRVVVDLTGLVEGTYQITPLVDILLAHVNVETILPASIEVILSPAPTPTPTEETEITPTPTP